MNSNQINSILMRTMGSSHFAGVFAANRLPSPRKNFPYGLVVNTDKEGGPGQHWLAIWMTGPKRAEFFDSFGDGPPSSTISKYLDENDIKITVQNRKKIQANYEISCGPFVIYYLVMRIRGRGMPEIVARLARNKFVDTYVKLFVSSLL